MQRKSSVYPSRPFKVAEVDSDEDCNAWAETLLPRPLVLIECHDITLPPCLKRSFLRVRTLDICVPWFALDFAVSSNSLKPIKNFQKTASKERSSRNYVRHFAIYETKSAATHCKLKIWGRWRARRMAHRDIISSQLKYKVAQKGALLLHSISKE